MSQRRDEAREEFEQRLSEDLRERSEPIRLEIAELKAKREEIDAKISELNQTITNMYEAHRETLTRVD